jgi:hypothetical protein
MIPPYRDKATGGNISKLFGKLLKPKKEKSRINYKKLNLNSTIKEEIYHFLMEKKCSKCEITKNVDQFNRDITTKDGFKYSCKMCQKLSRNKEKDSENSRKYNEQNKEVLKEKRQIYLEENKERISKQKQEYRNREVEKLKLIRKKYLPIKRERYQNDINYKLTQLLRCRIKEILKSNKSKSSINYVGCDLPFLKKWFEFRFDENMSWDNLGSYWQIDHILPINAFDFTDEKQVNSCFHWTNLQPLNAKENRLKSDKLHLHYFEKNIKNVEQFNKINDQFLGYQVLTEMQEWLKKKDFRYGKNPSGDNVLQNTFEMDNPQPSS